LEKGFYMPSAGINQYLTFGGALWFVSFHK
jgi:hypothetical protein